MTHLAGDLLQAVALGIDDPDATSHLAQCEHCEGELDTWRRLLAQLSGHPEPAINGEFTAEVMARIDDTLAGEEAWPLSTRVPLALGSGFVALVVIGALFGIEPAAFASFGADAARALAGAVKLQVLFTKLVSVLPSEASALVVLGQLTCLLLVGWTLHSLVRSQSAAAELEVEDARSVA